MTKIDKRDRASLFRRRLATAMTTKGTTQAALARTIGVDRSTISQLLGADESRLPNAQVVAECAAALGVTADWLLGLSDRPEQAADLLAASMTMTPAQRALVDEQIFEWHREADGYKQWLLEIARRTTEAGKEGGNILGRGAVLVNEAERVALAEVAAALGLA